MTPATPDRFNVLVMGVSGSGKSTVGRRLAERLDAHYVDADDLHPPANIAKMTAGVPLTDNDRLPWLDAVAQTFVDSPERSRVLACSALRRSYRDRIRRTVPDLHIIHLEGPREMLRQRLAERIDHVMPSSLLDSQLAALEPRGDDEPGATISFAGDVATVVESARRALTAQAPSRRPADPEAATRVAHAALQRRPRA